MTLEIITGYNQEKIAITNALNSIKYYGDAKLQVADLKARLVEIDKILLAIVKENNTK